MMMKTPPLIVRSIAGLRCAGKMLRSDVAGMSWRVRLGFGVWVGVLTYLMLR